MRKSLIVAVALMALNCVCAQDLSVVRAWKYGAKVYTFVKVVDEAGNAVSNASMCVVFSNGISANDDTLLRGFTDSNGVFRIQGKCKYNMTIDATKEGFYRGWHFVQLDAMKTNPAVVDGYWQTDTNGYVVTIKRVKNPIELNRCPQRSQCRDIPIFNEWVAYDFEKWDFCEPYGEGESEDVLFRFTEDPFGRNCGDYSLEMSFTNHPYAGFYTASNDNTSELWFDYEALTNKNDYSSSVKYELISDRTNRVGKTLKWTKLDSGEYLIFRTRTKVDDKGNLVSANYGRILGSLRYIKEFRFTDAWFNPAVNDPNLEDLHRWQQIQRQRKKDEKR